MSPVLTSRAHLAYISLLFVFVLILFFCLFCFLQRLTPEWCTVCETSISNQLSLVKLCGFVASLMIWLAKGKIWFNTEGIFYPH